MKDSLQSTYYCDCDHPDIQELAAILKSDGDDQISLAMRTFTYVRDNIIFGFDLFQVKASDTLKRKYGACWNKSLLLTALLRSNQINAQFGSIPLKRNFIKPAIGRWFWLANSPYNHCVVHAYINNRWTIIDAVLDKHTYETFYSPLGVEWGIDWDGKEDVSLYTESISGSSVMHQEIDAILNKKVGNNELPKTLASIGNSVINRQIWKKTGFTG